MTSVIAYLAALRPGKAVLWCYLIWYGVNATLRFDPAPAIWLNSVGISVLIGFALLLSVAQPAGARVDRWQTFRLFAMPFCVSSFSSLIKGQGYVLIFPPALDELLLSVGACALFLTAVVALKALRGRRVGRP